MSGPGRKPVRSLLALVGLLFGPFLLFIGMRDLQGALAARSWPPQPGVVTYSAVESGGSVRNRTSEPVIRFRYTIGEDSYRGDRIRYSLWTTESAAEALTAGYSEGDSVQVFVDPRNPARAVLLQGGALPAAAETAAGIVLLIFWIRAALMERREKRIASH